MQPLPTSKANAATDDTSTPPRPRATIPSRAACVSRIVANT